MKNLRRFVSRAFVATVMSVGATSPASAVYDSQGNLVAVIITAEETYY
ncbi:hypothetical protein [uncultured Sphingomonas sp.]